MLGVPCLTLRENTERPVTVQTGTNAVVGGNIQAIVEATDRILGGASKVGQPPDLWDGRSGERIVDILVEAFE